MADTTFGLPDANNLAMMMSMYGMGGGGGGFDPSVFMDPRKRLQMSLAQGVAQNALQTGPTTSLWGGLARALSGAAAGPLMEKAYGSSGQANTAQQATRQAEDSAIEAGLPPDQRPYWLAAKGDPLARQQFIQTVWQPYQSKLAEQNLPQPSVIKARQFNQIMNDPKSTPTERTAISQEYYNALIHDGYTIRAAPDGHLVMVGVTGGGRDLTRTEAEAYHQAFGAAAGAAPFVTIQPGSTPTVPKSTVTGAPVPPSPPMTGDQTGGGGAPAPAGGTTAAAPAGGAAAGGAATTAAAPAGGATAPAPAGTQPTQPINVDTKLDEIMLRESGGQNIKNKQGSGAEGYWQIMPGTWKEGMQLAGFSPEEQAKYTHPMAASYNVQRRVAEAEYEKYGEKPWASSAPKGATIAPPPGQATAAPPPASAAAAATAPPVVAAPAVAPPPPAPAGPQAPAPAAPPPPMPPRPPSVTPYGAGPAMPYGAQGAFGGRDAAGNLPQNRFRVAPAAPPAPYGAVPPVIVPPSAAAPSVAPRAPITVTQLPPPTSVVSAPPPKPAEKQTPPLRPDQVNLPAEPGRAPGEAAAAASAPPEQKPSPQEAPAAGATGPAAAAATPAGATGPAEGATGPAAAAPAPTDTARFNAKDPLKYTPDIKNQAGGVQTTPLPGGGNQVIYSGGPAITTAESQYTTDQTRAAGVGDIKNQLLSVRQAEEMLKGTRFDVGPGHTMARESLDAWNAFLRAAGEQPSGEALTAPEAWAILDKATTRLQLALGGAVGGGAASTVQTAGHGVPSAENTPAAIRALTSSLWQQVQRYDDIVTYKDAYRAKVGNLVGAQDSFDRTYTPASYEKAAQFDLIDPGDKQWQALKGEYVKGKGLPEAVKASLDKGAGIRGMGDYVEQMIRDGVEPQQY
jgi:hypothetical protein